MNKKTPEAQVYDPAARAFELDFAARINQFYTAELPEGVEGQEIEHTKVKRTIDGYKGAKLSKPEVMIQFYFNLLRLPAVFIPQVVDSLMIPALENLRASAKLSFDAQTGEITLAAYPLNKNQPVPENLRPVLSHLLSLEKGSVVTVEQVARSLLAKGAQTPEAADEISKRVVTFTEKDTLTHHLIMLQNYLKGLRLTPDFEGLEALLPLKILDGAVTQSSSEGKVIETWGFSLKSDFMLEDEESRAN